MTTRRRTRKIECESLGEGPLTARSHHLLLRRALKVLRRLIVNGGHLRLERPQGETATATCRRGRPRTREVFLMFSPRNRFARPVAEVDAILGARMIAAGWLEEVDGGWRPSPFGRAVAEGREPAVLLAETPGEAAREIMKETRPMEDGTPRTFTVTQAESPLEWLARHRDARGNRYLTEEEVEAAHILRADYEKARFSPRVTMAWDATRTAGDRRRHRGAPRDPAGMPDFVLEARKRLRRALAAIGPGLDEIVLEIVCLARGLEAAERRLGWPRRAGKLALKLALARLARHYGLVQEPPEVRVSRILAWALPDGHPVQALPSAPA